MPSSSSPRSATSRKRVRALEAGADELDRQGHADGADDVARDGGGRRAAMIPRPREDDRDRWLHVDLSASPRSRDGVTVPLTQREVEIVPLLRGRQIGHVVSRASSCRTCGAWRRAARRDASMSRSSALRAKVEKDPENPR